MSTLRKRNIRSIRRTVGSPFADLIAGLGYCCPYFFTKYFLSESRSLVALRLGCDVTTVQNYRNKLRQGKLACADCPNCLEKKLNEKLTSTS